MNFNKVFLAGNLTRDPECRYTPNGTAITSFGIAVNRKYKSGNEWKSEANFFDVEVWGKQGENCSEYLQKGSPVFIEGYLKQDRWEDESGNKRSKIKVVASSVQFLLRKQDGNTKNNNKGSEEAPPPSYEDHNLPF